jgi:tripartite-type tricarboxylate transporter receptor subunit TctC
MMVACSHASPHLFHMQALGADPSGNTPEEFARFIRADQAKWAKLMREAGIKPEGG